MMQSEIMEPIGADPMATYVAQYSASEHPEKEESIEPDFPQPHSLAELGVWDAAVINREHTQGKTRRLRRRNGSLPPRAKPVGKGEDESGCSKLSELKGTGLLTEEEDRMRRERIDRLWKNDRESMRMVAKLLGKERVDDGSYFAAQ